MITIHNIEKSKFVKATDLHKLIIKSTRYADFVKRHIAVYGGNISIGKTTSGEKGGRPTIDYLVPLNNAVSIALNVSHHTKDKGAVLDVYSFLCSEQDTPILIYREKLEHSFKQLLLEIIGNQYEIIYQYRVGKFLIDFYIPYLNIAIEYDENRTHKYTAREDIARQKEIVNEINCEFIRVDEGEELKSISLIVSRILQKERKQNLKLIKHLQLLGVFGKKSYLEFKILESIDNTYRIETIGESKNESCIEYGIEKATAKYNSIINYHKKMFVDIWGSVNVNEIL